MCNVSNISPFHQNMYCDGQVFYGSEVTKDNDIAIPSKFQHSMT